MHLQRAEPSFEGMEQEKNEEYRNFGKSGRLSFMILLHTSINFVFDFQGQKGFCLCRFYGIHVAYIFFLFYFSFSFLATWIP
jgi:hypothetical protein